jgi:opacity protein-like surface antigen
MSKRLIAAISVLTVLGLAGPAWSSSISLELRAGYHVPASAAFRDVYKGGPAFAGQLEVRLTKTLSLWAGAEYFGKTGKLTFTGEETKIRIIPLTAGLKAQLDSKSLCPYLAAGAGYFLYKEENIIGTADGSVFGFLGQAGLLFKATKFLYLDLYARYSAGRTKAAGPAILAAELGGFQGGLGLIIGF